MPTSLGPNPVASGDNYTNAATLGPLALLSTIQVVIAGAAVVAQLAKNNRDGKPIWDTEEITLPVGSWGFSNVQGIRMKSAIAGNSASITSCNGYYEDDAVPFDLSSAQNATTTITTFTGGQSGVFTIPPDATLITVIAIGGGGGGSGGGRSGSTGSATTGGCGGGGGAVSVMHFSAAELLALYPGGVPYQVGNGGSGGAGQTASQAAQPGSDGGRTIFGRQVAGGGGGGPATAPNNGQGGAGGGLSSAVNKTPGAPSVAGFNSSGLDIQAGIGNSQSTPQGPTMYGGAGAGSNQVGNIGGSSVGFPGGNSMYGGCGGGGGGGFVGTTGVANVGGNGGSPGYGGNGTSAGHGANGTFIGPYCGSAGDGGAGANTSGTKPNGENGGIGSTGSGGGGGGGAGPGAAGSGGKGGDGLLLIFVS